MARKKKHEEHANHEAWAIPYADLMTLLLAFFVVMYAISSLNEGKYRVMADALTAAFGGAPRTINPVQVGNHQLQGSDYDRPSPIKSGAKQGPSAPSPAPNPTLLPALASHMRTGQPMDVTSTEAVRRARRQLGEIAAQLEQALGCDVLTRVDPTTVRFSHELIRSVLYDAIAPTQRRQWHARVAVLLEPIHAERMPDPGAKMSTQLP